MNNVNSILCVMGLSSEEKKKCIFAQENTIRKKNQEKKIHVGRHVKARAWHVGERLHVEPMLK